MVSSKEEHYRMSPGSGQIDGGSKSDIGKIIWTPTSLSKFCSLMFVFKIDYGMFSMEMKPVKIHH